ncbi:Receptor-like protein kinase [Actinidia chinensis var. chinensis]|uniref:non-specific serine/threonine protein kinase n=1 Tax=Actinidia chinensis var. chinensis TaxID=1590841 RepID=A0A2R6Q6W2_ACTCC|nr:Receptor-like protein kinase [Actinidia chinensis var. chinensis]
MTIPNITTDQSALLALKSSLILNPNSILVTNWTTRTSVCNWIGVVCGRRHKRVVALNIPSMGLVGTLPPSLGNLSFLVRINMFNNSFYGHLPEDLAKLRRLKYISVRLNNLGGQMPSWLGSLRNLQFLLLGNNNFTGKIPLEIGNLRDLRKLDTQFNQLTGTIPPHIFNISSLELIALSMNGLSGNLPADMCYDVPQLKFLYLSGNKLSGEVPPSLHRCSELEMLSLAINNFAGPITSGFGNLTKLEQLYLAKNHIEGSLPSGIGNCTNLKLMYLTFNNFAGSIPQVIGKLHNLEELEISGNSLSDSIPSSIFNMSTLQILSLADNNLSGYLPSNIGDWLPNLRELKLGGNSLTGVIPNSLSNASRLTQLDLILNSFTGYIPNTLGKLKLLQFLGLGMNNLTSKSSVLESSLMNCKQLRKLWIGGNPLNVILPDTIGNLSYLESLSMENCEFMGNIPRAIGNLSNLIAVDLQDNDLDGVIPPTIGQLEKLQILALGSNKLQGSIPNDLCHLRNLAYLFLSGNKLSGSLPACIGNVTRLRTLHVGSNELTSGIPSTLWKLNDLLDLYLSSNSLSGEISLEIGNLKVVNQIDISRNQLSGDIPSSIGSLQNLVNLSLAHNRFQGLIPPSFASLRSLEFLDLSQNNLSGAIPKTLQQLSYLKYLNLSFNKLEGEIPETGPFANFTAQSFIGNKALCGVPRFQVQPCTSAHHRSKKSIVLVAYILPISAAILLTLVSIIALTRCHKGKTRIPNQENLFPWMASERFSHQQLLRATSGFAECNLIGKGSFSSVYKGTLSDGRTVAIKVFDLEMEGSLKSFDVECEVMRNVRHRNLIKVIGSCSNLDFKALVMDYMPSGSLEKWLHNPGYCLDILQRMNIMIDVASALGYLHHGYSTPVVHCDVKPSNVLLDEDMVAHLSDYGIAKLFNKDESTVQTKTMGTIGYIPPEYGSKGIVSTKGDVYSYGIMLLEAFSRKKPTDEMFVEEMSLKQWVNNSLHQASVEVIDADILTNNDEHFVIKEQCIKFIMELALSCCADSPEERVDLENIIVTLEKIKFEFLSKIHGV